jgi:hypothetical protein
MTKSDLLQQLECEVATLKDAMVPLADQAFFARPAPGKWSPAENVAHLVLSVRPLVLAFSLPRMVLRVFGAPHRPSRPYHELVALYRQKLAEGARASRPYVPSQQFRKTPQQMLQRFERTYNRFAAHVNPWQEDQLDQYQLPHPILGNLTLREMLAFTVYHVYHHHQLLKSRL